MTESMNNQAVIDRLHEAAGLEVDARRLLLDAVLAHAVAVRAYELAVLAIVAPPLMGAAPTTDGMLYAAYLADGKTTAQDREDRRDAFLAAALDRKLDARVAAKTALERATVDYDNAHLWWRTWAATADLLAGGGQ